ADESTGTIKKRFDSIGTPSTEDSRRDYREMLFRTEDAMRNHISGVILFDETLRQKAADGTPLVDLIRATGAVPGIKVDAGAKPMPGYPGETVTEGLDGLRERLAEYHGLGARFAKWRGVISISSGLPSWGAVKANAHALARYAALCQEAGIVPIVEPEVLMDGKRGGGREDPSLPEADRACRGAGNRVPVGRPVGRGSHRPSFCHERGRAAVLEPDIFVWPRPAGGGAGCMGRQACQCRRGAARLRA